jgi:hypothetical protein
MVEKEGERCFIVDLWRSYAPLNHCAFAIIDHALGRPSFSQPGRERLPFGMQFSERSVH